jgi:hypothetical protein
VRILAVDTASERRDRGYAIVDGGQLVWTDVRPPTVTEAGDYIDVVVGERPWAGQKLKGQALITFCVNNGFQLRDAWPHHTGQTYILLPVRDWKHLALPGCAGMPGEIFCANLRQKYAPHIDNHNQLDAIGMAVAASRLMPAQLKKYVPKGFLR